MDTGLAKWARLMLTLRSSVTAFGRRTQVAHSHIILRQGVRVEDMRQGRGAARCKIQRCRGRREQQDKARRRTVSSRKCWCSCWCHGKARYSHAVPLFVSPLVSLVRNTSGHLPLFCPSRAIRYSCLTVFFLCLSVWAAAPRPVLARLSYVLALALVFCVLL
jgi:hypothetical protein